MEKGEIRKEERLAAIVGRASKALSGGAVTGLWAWLSQKDLQAGKTPLGLQEHGDELTMAFQQQDKISLAPQSISRRGTMSKL